MPSIRRIILICAVTGVTGTAVIAWASGLLEKVTGFFAGLYSSVEHWLNSPWSIEHMLSGVGALLIPLILVAIAVAVISDL